MGVQGLWKLLECTGRPINPETLEGKILAVDISIWLNQAIKGARDRQGNAMQNAHLLTLFHRLCKLLFFRIRPIFVFDGEAPLLKKQTLAKRRQKKDYAADEAKKTNDKLLKTFLKRQAIKAALSGNKQSDEEFPSLSRIQRKEEEDIYALPPLEEKERNSSEEEEEREWEERMNQKQVLQEEFFANPHSVDIESEEFNNLPPEMKHEILTDMKEFTKRRRTLFEAMPEGSDDFSQYQLKGLLKKNDLNRCLDNVRKEMSQQYSGEVRAQFETEGGFMREVETNRLVSEDTSHYILIKGIKSKTPEKKEEITEQAVATSSSNDAVPKTYLDFKMASAHKSKKTKDPIPEISPPSQPEATPPSPRTLFAIQEAMLENSSDEETGHLSSKPQRSTESGYAIGGDVSPRTLHAIQQALAEDEVGMTRKRPLPINDDEDREQPRAKVFVISSSDEEDVALVSEDREEGIPVISIKRAEYSPSPAQSHTSADNENSLLNSPVSHQTHSELMKKLDVSPIEKVGFNALVRKTNLASCPEIIIEPCPADLPSSSVKPFPALESQSHPSRNREDPILISSEIESSKIKLNSPPYMELVASEKENKLKISADQERSSIRLLDTSVSPQATAFSTDNKSSPEVSIESNSATAVVPIQQDVSESKSAITESDQSNIAYIPMTPESISDRDKEMDSDSDGSFIEVESDLDNSSSHLMQRPAISSDNIVPEATSKEDELADAGQSSDIDENSLTEKDQDVVPQQPEESRDQKAAENEWQDINPEELELLENNLFVQQTSLQAQRQQQERVAASVTGQMYLESQELLRLFGIPYIVAPMEAEAQCAVLDLTDQTSGTITDDSDIWLFGARHVYKNFFAHNKYVEYYQFSDLQNQLGLDRSKLINVAYLTGSDYTEGITSVGCVSAMEILNEFPGHGLEPLLRFKEWWTEAQKNKKTRPNPNDTKVKKKLRNLELHPGFPNKAVADAYMKPVVDESKGAFSWGRPDLEQIREFCESRFGWYRSKADEVLLPVMKQLNAQQTQLRIDSFFHVEQHEARALKSQRVRRAVTCMKRKEKDSEAAEIDEATTLMEKEYAIGDQQKAKISRNSKKSHRGKRKKEATVDGPDEECVDGGFIGPGIKTLTSEEKSSSDSDNDKGPNTSKEDHATTPVKAKKVETSSSSEDEVNMVLVSAKPVFLGNKRKPRAARGRKR